MSCDTEIQYREQKERLFNLIVSRTKDRETSMDILQEAFVRFEECRQQGSTCTFPKSYLYKIALNLVADFHNRKKRETEGLTWAHYMSHDDQEDLDLTCDINECVQIFLPKIPKTHREAFIQTDLLDIPQEEQARNLKIPSSTLRSRVQRARSYLRKAILECMGKC